MSDNAERLWLQDSLNQTSIKRAAEAINRLGKALPCQVVAIKGSIVTVSFEISGETLPNVTIPKGEGQWIRSPTQKGDYGLTMPADVYLGGISGLGGGTANTIRRGNLTALQWIPTAAVSFPGVNTNAAYIAGPEGAVIQDQAGHCIAVISNNGTITLTAQTTIALNAPTIELNGQITQGTGTLGTNATFIGPINVVNDVTIGTTSFETHYHTDPQGGDTGPPVAGS